MSLILIQTIVLAVSSTLVWLGFYIGIRTFPGARVRQSRWVGGVGNRLREAAEFMIAPLSPGFNLERYDRELRRPFPSEPQFAPESKVWRREHGITDHAKSVASVHTQATSTTSRP